MQVRGRFAPTPSGRMHLGNLFAALLCWLDVRAQEGELLLRIEDLDRARCRPAYTAQLVDDLRWLGLDWDRGYPMEGASFLQSTRAEAYHEALTQLEARGLVYPCYCNRQERLAASAPHQSDGSVRYSGRCRDLTEQEQAAWQAQGRRAALRLRVGGAPIAFTDDNFGPYTEQLEESCGDIILRRADGVFAYQLAVVVDDALMGVNRVVRGSDLLSSTARQRYLGALLGYAKPSYAHTPLLVGADGRRLSKRERDLDMGVLRARTSPARLLGYLAFVAGLLDRPEAMTAQELVPLFSWEKVGRADKVVPTELPTALLH